MGISIEVCRNHILVQECVETPAGCDPGALENHECFFSVLLTIQKGLISFHFEVLQKKHMNSFLFLQV